MPFTHEEGARIAKATTIAATKFGTSKTGEKGKGVRAVI